MNPDLVEAKLGGIQKEVQERRGEVVSQDAGKECEKRFDTLWDQFDGLIQACGDSESHLRVRIKHTSSEDSLGDGGAYFELDLESAPEEVGRDFDDCISVSLRFESGGDLQYWRNPHTEKLVKVLTEDDSPFAEFQEDICKQYEDCSVATEELSEGKVINDTSQVFAFSPNVGTWLARDVDTAYKILGNVEHILGETFGYLMDAACDDELNPDIAEQARAYRDSLRAVAA